MIPFMQDTQNRQIHRDRKQNQLCLAEGGENGELLSNGYRVSFWDDEKVLEMDNGDNCTTLVNILNGTEFYTPKGLKRKLLYVLLQKQIALK